MQLMRQTAYQEITLGQCKQVYIRGGLEQKQETETKHIETRNKAKQTRKQRNRTQKEPK